MGFLNWLLVGYLAWLILTKDPRGQPWIVGMADNLKGPVATTHTAGAAAK